MPFESSTPGTILRMAEGKGNRAEDLAFWQARSVEPIGAPFILMLATRLLCLSLMQIHTGTPRLSASSVESLSISMAWFQVRSGGG